MNISKSSWHYRLIRWLDRWPKSNFCPYVRQIFYALVSVAGISFGISIVALFAAIILTYPIAQFWYPNGVIGGIGFVAYIIIGAVSIKIYREEQFYRQFTWWAPWFHYDFLKPLKDALPERKEKIYKPPGIFRQWIRATHDKACPVVTFNEEERGL